MGLLSRLGRKATNFADGAMERMSRRADPLNYTSDRFAPLASAVYGGFGGALGAAGGGALSLARQGAAGLRGGFQNMMELGDSNPMEVAEAVKALASREGAEAAQQALKSMQRANPALFEQVMQFLG